MSAAERILCGDLMGQLADQNKEIKALERN